MSSWGEKNKTETLKAAEKQTVIFNPLLSTDNSFVE